MIHWFVTSSYILSFSPLVLVSFPSVYLKTNPCRWIAAPTTTLFSMVDAFIWRHCGPVILPTIEKSRSSAFWVAGKMANFRKTKLMLGKSRFKPAIACIGFEARDGALMPFHWESSFSIGLVKWWDGCSCRRSNSLQRVLDWRFLGWETPILLHRCTNVTLNSVHSHFLDAPSHLYKRSCPSVGP